MFHLEKQNKNKQNLQQKGLGGYFKELKCARLCFLCQGKNVQNLVQIGQEVKKPSKSVLDPKTIIPLIQKTNWENCILFPEDT